MAPEHMFCSQCGQPVSAAARARTEPFPRGSPPPRADPIPAILAVLIITAALVTFAVGAYYLLQAPAGGPSSGVGVDLQGPYGYAGSIVITVASATQPVAPEALLLNLEMNGTTGSPVLMPSPGGTPVAIWTAAGPYLVSWQDNDYDGHLSAGDTFTLSSTTAPPSCCRFLRFLLLWRSDGSVLAELAFYEPPPPPPYVVLGGVSRGSAANAYIPLLAVNQPAPPLYFSAQLVVDHNGSAIIPIPPANSAINVTVGGGEYIIAWYDTQNDGLVDAGDAFNVTRVSVAGPPSGTVVTFELVWLDSSVLAVASWTT